MADLPANTTKESIIKLALMDKIEFERCRENEAKNLNMRVTFLDELVAEERKKNESANDDGGFFPKDSPWEYEVNLSDLLNYIVEIINRYMVLPSTHEATAIALWIVLTYFIDVLECAPILHIKSPDLRCGKTTLSRIISKMSHKSFFVSNVSPAALFRLIEQYAPTLIIDEADSFLKENEELRGIINSGHSRDAAFIIRCQGDNHDVKKFCTFGPKVISGIGSIADTIEDRSITINLRRMLDTEKKAKMSMHNKNLQIEFNNIRSMCFRFMSDKIDQLKDIIPDMPLNLNDRAADNWHPLLALATLADEGWINKAKDAAIALNGNDQVAVTIGVELLIDIQEILLSIKLKYPERISSYDLLAELNLIDDAPWQTYNHGKPMTARNLSNKLKEFGVKSKDM